MKSAYIRFNDRKYVKLIEKILVFIKKCIIKISIEKLSINKFEDSCIILIPKYKKYNVFVKNIILKQIKKCLACNRIENLVFDENVKFLEKELIDVNNKSEKYLMKFLILRILEYIFNINKINTQLENIYVFVNQYSKNNVKIIENLCKNFKTVNVITENLKYYKRVESSFHENGMLLTVSNNKRKSARNAKYIINIDFEKQKIEQYNVNMDSIIINMTNEKQLFNKYFRGVLINDIDIIVDNDFVVYIEEVYGNVNVKQYLESVFINKNCIGIEEDLLKYNVQVIGLIGVRGQISHIEI